MLQANGAPQRHAHKTALGWCDPDHTHVAVICWQAKAARGCHTHLRCDATWGTECGMIDTRMQTQSCKCQGVLAGVFKCNHSPEMLLVF